MCNLKRLSSSQCSQILFPGRLSVITGPMCSGKTTAIADLVQCLAKMTAFNRFLLCCPEADARTGQVLQARNDERCYTVHKFSKPSEIVLHIISQVYRQPYGALVIDDAQFFEENDLAEMVTELQAIVPRLTIVLVMLDYMADGRQWVTYQSIVGMFRPNLFVLAAKCEVFGCVHPATRTYFAGTLPLNGVQPGYASYFPMCEDHWSQAHESVWSPERGFGEI